MLCRQHWYPWRSLPTSPYRSSPLAGHQGYIPYPHTAAVCMFELVVLLLLGHMRGFIGVHHLWACPWAVKIIIIGKLGKIFNGWTEAPVRNGNRRTSRDNPNYSIVMIGYIPEKIPRDLRRFAVFQPLETRPPAWAGENTSQEIRITIIIAGVAYVRWNDQSHYNRIQYVSTKGY